MITLYHGSNVTVDMPKILPKLRALDFGGGFYLTSSYAQAERWAKVIFKRRQAGQPIVNIYTFDDDYDMLKEFISKLNPVLKSHSELLKISENILTNLIKAQNEISIIISQNEYKKI